MILSPGFIGIDVSKDYLDIYDGGVHGASQQAPAIAAYLKAARAAAWCCSRRPALRCGAASTLAIAGCAMPASPGQARALRGRAQAAKTDTIDAVSCEMAQALQPSPHQERMFSASIWRTEPTPGDQLVDMPRWSATAAAVGDTVEASIAAT